MSDVVAVAFITGAVAIAAAWMPAHMSSKVARSARLAEHRAWERERRFEACRAVAATASAIGVRSMGVKYGAGQEGAAMRYTELLADLDEAVGSIGVLGPLDLSESAKRVRTAATDMSTAALRLGHEEQDEARIGLIVTLDDFQLRSQELLAAPQGEGTGRV